MSFNLLAAVVLGWLGLGRPKTPVEPPVVTVLCYHTFDSPKITPFTVTHHRLDEQMRFLSVQHWPVIPLQQLSAYLNGEKVEMPPRSIVITIDDGYKSAATVAWPIMRKYHFPFTLFVYSGALSRHPSALTWDEAKAMAKAGVDIESHTETHPLLTHPGRAMMRAEYTSWLDHQLVDSKKEIETHLSTSVTALAYPYGGYSEYVMERVRKAGYTSAFTCDDSDVTKGVDPLTINRRLVYRQTSVQTFARYFTQRPLQVVDRSPRDGERLKEPPSEIRGRILDVHSLVPQTVKILVDKTGRRWVTVPVDPATGLFHYIIPKTDKRGFFFVALSGRDRLNSQLNRGASWLYIVKGNASKK